MPRFITFFLLLLSLPALAMELPRPKGQVILRVTGEIGQTNLPGGAHFDAAMLRDLPLTEFTTMTTWTEGEQVFSGVALSDFLKVLSVSEGTLRASAVNDYTVEIPVSDAVPGGPIIAYLRNGNEMSRRDKGPLWIVYPYDSHPDFRTELILSRSIWQLNRIVVTP